VPFVVNRSLSYFGDTLMFANEMNRFHHTPNKMQYEFYLNLIRKRKRFSKWAKKQDSASLDLVKEYYNFSHAKAEEALTILSSDDLESIRKKMFKGGR
jgi:trimethylamine:corrinoid methyltransferase-like protein